MGPDDEIEFSVDTWVSDGSAFNKKIDPISVTAPIGAVFVASFDDIIGSASEYRLREAIGTHVAKIKCISGKSFEVSIGDVIRFRRQLEALDFIETHRSGNFDPEGAGDTMLRWEITRKARRYVGRIRALKREA